MASILLFSIIGPDPWQTVAVIFIVFASHPGDLKTMPAYVYSILDTVPRVLFSGVSLLGQPFSVISASSRCTKCEATARSTGRRCKTTSALLRRTCWIVARVTLFLPEFLADVD